MTRIRSRAIWSIGALVLAAGLLTGCPKRPEVEVAKVPPAGATDSAGSGGAGTDSAGGAVIGGAAGMAQPGGSGASGGQAGGIGAGGGAGAGGAGGPAAGGGAGAAGGAGQPGSGTGAAAGTGSSTDSGGSGAGAGAGLAAGPPTGTTLPSLPSPAEFVEAKELSDVHFDFDKADIRPGDQTVLDGNAAWLKTNAMAQVLIEGHCDERGTNEYNLALGERRAKAARDYLASVGVDPGRVTVISYGKERPVCTEANEGCWSKNRRAHFLVKQ